MRLTKRGVAVCLGNVSTQYIFNNIDDVEFEDDMFTGYLDGELVTGWECL